ncbi:unnamed protein product [Caenorhabditis bovis]|uniref:Dolichol-phosphate mannosyltransferase subunit 3 n=1 Tax=Caenorhabditis bovis TaxID=2654633 RepID=A0A8S1F844_9PELO|nr:unnamed protein product [Caenorhabditis bovis]
MVSQAVIFLGHLVPLTLIWVACVHNIIPVNNYLPEFAHHFVLYAPIFAVIMLGIYAVGSVVYGVATFNDCAEAREELIQEIKEAREDLKKRKVLD